jgi:hypothetical protein
MKIKKMLLLYSLYIFLGSSQSSGMYSVPIDFNAIRMEIEWFIDKVKPESVEQGKYNVYLVKLYTDDENRYCITIGYIMDSLWVSEIQGFKHFTRVKGELVLLQYSDFFNDKLDASKNGIEQIADHKIVTDKIYPGAWVVGTTPGYVCCFEVRNIMKMYYDNADAIPYEKKIFKYIPQGQTIKMDSSEMKKMFRKKKKD